MPSLRLYRLNDSIDGEPVTAFGDFLSRNRPIDEHGPFQGVGFTAMLYQIRTPAQPPAWSKFLVEAFDTAAPWPASSPTSALLIVRLDGDGSPYYYAIPFGSGRFELRRGAFRPAFGLRTALNLIYPRDEQGDAEERVHSLDTRRHGATTLRSRHQAAAATELTAFEVDQLRDVVRSATGRPADAESWGTRISGDDTLTVNLDRSVADLGTLCVGIEAAAERDDYRERFAWLDYIQPVSDLGLIADLQQEVLTEIAKRDETEFVLSPPEIVDWAGIDRFRFQEDRRVDLRNPDLRLRDYLGSLARNKVDLETLTPEYLKARQVEALDAGGDRVYRWPIWSCLSGTITSGDETYVIADGDFFRVDSDYLSELNRTIEDLEIQDPLPLPVSHPNTEEKHYNRQAADVMTGSLLLDRKNVIRSGGNAVELCDLLTDSRDLIHVKRHLSSSTLSHLFAQGAVSAQLIQMDPVFRAAARAKVAEAEEAGQGFSDLFPEDGIQTQDFRVVYAIVEDWGDKELHEALPFFSKVNLRRAAEDLRGRGFAVACQRVQVDGNAPHLGDPAKS